MSDRREEIKDGIIKELEKRLASAHDKRRQAEERNKQENANTDQLIKKFKDHVRKHGTIPAASTSLDTLHVLRKLAPELFENSIDWSGATKVQLEMAAADTLRIPINFIDEDGEVSELQTTMDEGTSYVFDRYACQQYTPFLLSRVLYEFRYNGKVVPLNVTFGSIVVASDDNVIIYVTTKVPNREAFNNRIVPNIPAFVKNHPRCFIDKKVSGGSLTGTCTIKDYIRDTGSFVLEDVDDHSQYSYGIDQFIKLLQDYYSESGFTYDMRRYLFVLVLSYESQVKQLDTDQGIDEPNAIILRMIKIKQQIYRLLNYIHVAATSKEEWGERGDKMFNYLSSRLSDALSLLADKKKSHLSNTSLHKVNKPILELEDIVRVKRWPNNDETLEPSWELGTILSYTEHDDIDGYGPRRVYSVEFDNGEYRSDVEDCRVISDENSLLIRIKESDRKQIGISHVYDKDSSDQWAREVGWCTVEIYGMEEPFVYLIDAVRAFNLKHGAGPEKQMELGMLQVIDRISNPIMRRIGRLLIRQIDSDYDDQWGMENSGVLWKMALGHYNDGNTKQMRDSVLRFAISRQCYDLDPLNDPLNIDLKKLYNFFICSEGCLDAFLLKVPIFREGYDSTIPPESDGRQSDPEVMMTYLKRNQPDDADEFMFVRFVCGNDTERYTVERDAPFKELLTKYAEYMCTSIKSLRIKHDGNLIFLSSIGNKAPRELGINEDDTLEITIIQSTPTEEALNQPSPKGKNKKKNKKKKHKKSNKKRPVQIAPPEDIKGEHSKLLGKVYEEAEPQFKEIRQRLNAMNLERTKPKQKKTQSKTIESIEVVDNPLGDDQGGKAGKTQFIIQVGEVSNLYKTTKPSSAGRRRHQEDIMIDLHGLTAEEAVYRLDKHLPNWIEIAMKGTYPFVIPVKIVCGGGSQILAEVVENWIKQNDNVANAPKNMYS